MHSLLLSQSRFATALALVCLLASSVSALDKQEASAKQPQPGRVNTKVSRVYIFVDKTGFGHQHAIEGMLASGNLVLGAQAAAGHLVFEMGSFNADTTTARKYIGLSGTTDASTRADVNANMKGRQVLDVQKYPQAIFEVVSAIATGETSKRGLPTYKLVGTFELHGTKRAISIVTEVEQDRGWLHVRGNFVVKQTAFGIKPFSKAFGAIGVADALRIYGDLWVAPNDQVAMSDIPMRK